MKNKIIVLITVLIATISSAQNGINYKAIVKDGSGNLITNDLIQVNFKILQGAAQTSIYEETHSQSTDANGLIALNIGDGTVISGDFTTIDWASDDTFLNVQINTGAGLVDLGTTAFSTVPYALQADKASNVFSGNYYDLNNTPTIISPTGLETIDEGNGTGWRLKGRNPANYGNIGNDAIDLSKSEFSSFNNGATGDNSIATGYSVKALGEFSKASGRLTTASGESSTASGSSTDASGDVSTAMGAATNATGYASTAMGSNNTASGDVSTTMGQYTIAEAHSTVAIGRFNIGGGNPTNWVSTDPIFEIGDGFDFNNRSNILTVLKNGKHSINSDSDGLVITTGSGSDDDGIYISSPGDDGIHIYNAGDNGIAVNGANDDGIYISSPGDDGIHIYNAGDNGIAVNDANRYGGLLRGTESGVYAEADVDTNPDLILGGNINSATGDDGVIASDPSTPGSDIFLRSNDAVVVQLDFDNNEAGNFEIKNGVNVEVFDVDESGNLAIAGSYSQSSDRRLKKGITDLHYGLNEILQLEPKSYYWKNREQSHKSLGLIAQEAQPIIKEIVTERDDEEKTLGISYTELIPVLINAIKEQNKRIDELEARLDSQETNVVARKD